MLRLRVLRVRGLGMVLCDAKPLQGAGKLYWGAWAPKAVVPDFPMHAAVTSEKLPGKTIRIWVPNKPKQCTTMSRTVSLAMRSCNSTDLAQRCCHRRRGHGPRLQRSHH